jgi:lipopolysaccharide/colanic/teichoic acid biosynthesis glycosyltransferase
VTDPASLKYRFEEELLARQPDPVSFYLQYLLPEKLDINLKYLSEISFVRDLKIIFLTIRAIFVSRPEANVFVAE